MFPEGDIGMRRVWHRRVADRRVGDIPEAVDCIDQPAHTEFGVGRIEVAGHKQAVGRMQPGSGRSDREYRPVEGDIPDLVGCTEDNLLVPDRSIHLKT